jgi:hypothetical protein
METPSNRFVLRNLPLASRLALATFLITVGTGYVSALVQLHFQHAPPGTLLPEPEDAANAYYGRTGMSQMERLLVVDEGKPFNGSGTMRLSFTTKSAGWRIAINRRAKEKKLALRQAEEELRSERDGERLAVLDWVRLGASRKAFEENNHILSSHLVHRPLTPDFVEIGPDRTTRVKVASILETRCVRCHGEGKSGSAAQFPLESWEQLHEYCEVETTEGGMSLKKLAQSTHVHLLSFGMLYGMTGLIFTLTSYPGWIRGLLGPFVLLAQIVDIGFWWLGRLDPLYARAIVFTGAAVAVGLCLQVILSLFNMFGRIGKILLVLLILSAGLGGYVVKDRVIDPYLVKEGISATVTE